MSQEPPSAYWAPAGRVFQYVGPTGTPAQIGWMTSNGAFTYDFRSERVGIWDGTVLPRDLIGEPRRGFEELVHAWERLVLARSQKQAVN